MRIAVAGATGVVGHHVAVSIIGIDQVGLGYYRGKRRQEQLIADGSVPWSVLRAAQFHEFCVRALDVARRYVRATGSSRRVIGLRVPGAAGRAMRAGRLRPATDGPRGTQTFEAWLRSL